MKITGIIINSFGIWNGIRFDNVSPEFNVIYGPNEAGKSTILAFMRFIFFGPSSKRHHAKDFVPVTTGIRQGEITFILNERSYTLSRKERLTPVIVPQIDLANALLTGISADTYERLFAFGQEELMEWETFKNKELDEVIYRVIDPVGGTDISPKVVLGSFEEATKRLYGQRSRGILRSLIKDRKNLRKELKAARKKSRELEKELSGIDGLRKERDLLSRKQREIRNKIEEFDRMISMFPRVEKIKNIEESLSSYPHQPFREDEYESFLRLLERRDKFLGKIEDLKNEIIGDRNNIPRFDSDLLSNKNIFEELRKELNDLVSHEKYLLKKGKEFPKLDEQIANLTASLELSGKTDEEILSLNIPISIQGQLRGLTSNIEKLSSIIKEKENILNTHRTEHDEIVRQIGLYNKDSDSGPIELDLVEYYSEYKTLKGQKEFLEERLFQQKEKSNCIQKELLKFEERPYLFNPRFLQATKEIGEKRQRSDFLKQELFSEGAQKFFDIEETIKILAGMEGNIRYIQVAETTIFLSMLLLIIFHMAGFLKVPFYLPEIISAVVFGIFFFLFRFIKRKDFEKLFSLGFNFEKNISFAKLHNLISTFKEKLSLLEKEEKYIEKLKREIKEKYDFEFTPGSEEIINEEIYGSKAQRENLLRSKDEVEFEKKQIEQAIVRINGKLQNIFGKVGVKDEQGFLILYKQWQKKKESKDKVKGLKERLSELETKITGLGNELRNNRKENNELKVKTKKILSSHGVPEIYDRNTLDAFLKGLDTLQNLIKKRSEYWKESETFSNKKSAFLEKAAKQGCVCDKLDEAEKELDKILYKLEKELTLATRADTLERSIKSKEKTLESFNKEINIVKEEITMLCKKFGCTDAYELKTLFQKLKERTALKKDIESIETEFRTEFGISISDAKKALSDYDNEAILKQRSELNNMERDVIQNLEIINQELGSLNEKRRNAEKEWNIAKIESNLEYNELLIRKHLYKFAIIITAKNILLDALREFELREKPELLKKASEIFSMFTENAYRDVFSSLFEEKSKEILAQRKSGEKVRPSEMSRGTRDQFFLSLRFAMLDVKNPSPRLPVFMDEILVNFDSKRTMKTIEVLKDISKRRQLFYLTCHPEVAEILSKKTSAHVIELKSQ